MATIYEKSLTLYDVAMKAGEIFQNAKEDKKRRLLRAVFANMKLDNCVLTYDYSHPYEVLYKAIQETNSSKVSGNEQFMNNIFELKDFSGVKAKMEPLGVDCSNWLPRVDSNHEPAG